MKDIISIIIPAFNAQNTIGNCISSIQNQSYSEYEIIIIDDGSTDETWSLIDKIMKYDERIVYFYQENKGPSAARNKGIEISTGKYVIFIDADDSIPYNYLECLIKAGDKYDLTICSMKKHDFNCEKLYELANNKSYETRKEFLIDIVHFMDRNLIQGPVNKLYNLSIIKEKQIKFNEKYTFGEDTLFVYDYINKCDSFFYTKETYYNYIFSNKDSLCNKYRKDRLKIYLTLNNKLNNLLLKNNIDNSIIYINNSIALMECLQLVKDRSLDYKDYKNKLKNDIVVSIDWEMIRSNNISTKLCITLLKMRLYFLLYIVYTYKIIIYKYL